MHDGSVQVGGGHQPRNERGILHGIPGPKAPPTENLIGPPSPKDDANGEEDPRDESPNSQNALPAVSESAPQSGSESNTEGDRHSNVTEIESWRMQNH